MPASTAPLAARDLSTPAGHCLDALLLLHTVDSSTPVRQLLTDSHVYRADGKPYTAGDIRRELDGLINYVSKSDYGNGYYVAQGLRAKLLGLRGTQDNTALVALAGRRYADLLNQRSRSYYYYADHATPAALALLANRPTDFQNRLQQLDQQQAQNTYYRIDRDLLDTLLVTPYAEFWTWRAPALQAAFLTAAGELPERLSSRTISTALDLYAANDYLEIEEFRDTELLGMYLIDQVLDREAVRQKHFDLDQLAALLRGSAPDPELLGERLEVITEQADFFDVVVLLLGIDHGLITPKAAADRLRTIATSNCAAGVALIEGYLRQFGTGQTLDEKVLGSLYGVRSELTPFDFVLLLWVCCWQGIRPPAPVIDDLVTRLTAGHYRQIAWPEGELFHGLAQLLPLHEQAPQWRERAEAFRSSHGIDYLLRLRPVIESWQVALRKVEQLTGTGPLVAGKVDAPRQDPPLRLIWIIDFDERSAYPKEQKLGKRGYTPGRKLRWDEVYHPQYREQRLPQDLASIEALRQYGSRPLHLGDYIASDSIRVEFGQLLYQLAGHPHLYLGEKERIPLDIVRETPSVTVAEREGSLEVRFDPPPSAPGHYQYKRITPTRYATYHLNDRQLQLSQAIEYGLNVPTSARDRLEAMLEGMRKDVTVQSDTDLLHSDLPVVEGSDRISVHLMPYGEGYRAELLARPVPDLPLYFPPGGGLLRSLIAGEESRRILERDLEAETKRAGSLVEALPPAGRLAGQHSYLVEEELPALQFLLALRGLVAEGHCEVEYPKGQQLRLNGQAGFDQLELRVGKQRDWFQVDANLRLDENKVLDLQFLLEQLRNNDSGFVKLGEQEFVAITDELRQKVRQMEGLLHERSGKLQLPTLAAAEFSEVIEDLPEVELAAEWEEALGRIQQASHLRPRPPEPFAATLRPYQKEGYEWMMRLAEWGVGACLADDMGLGKTVQGLAVLTARRERGPALVLAPASVIRNWRAECLRFAPALNPVLLARTSDKHLVEQLGPADVLLVSYGLLSYVAEELATVEYATLILDEAQAIKNDATKRARTVYELRSDFKVATTGTPIENHLGELWSLFRFLNPGLLSSKKAFAEKYAIPIARGEDAERRDVLRRLVQPFILRRRKDEVLKELPAKTEIVLEVEPSKEEAALYEAIRRDALKVIAEASPEEKRFKVLAQLTRLRQAACHPRLVRPQSKLPSAKLELVSETIRELLDGGHKALVFSQFVRHLKLVEDWVQQAGIPYQYLDGSTPGKQRAERVEAFQRGEGELFLISLKAGGTGLNLTEADYVLHLDPWWNPAVEDQASDRAHRIGQQRPVTVYRFVTQGTIEEQVIALHADKRDLADRILEGTGRAGKLEVDEILEMLRV